MRSLLEPLVFVNIPKYGFFLFFVPYTQHRRPFDSRFAINVAGPATQREYDRGVIIARRLRLNIII